MFYVPDKDDDWAKQNCRDDVTTQDHAHKTHLHEHTRISHSHTRSHTVTDIRADQSRLDRQ